MVRINGRSVSKGIAIGRLVFLKRRENEVVKQTITDTRGEIDRYKAAAEKAKEELSELEKKAADEAGKASAEIFEIHKMMLDDRDFVEMTEKIINDKKVNAEYAVYETSKEFSKIFSEMDNDYMKERAADVKDISERLIRILSEREDDNMSRNSDYNDAIICADELAPSETISLDKSRIIAFATRYGSAQSHTAILADTMNIPAIIGLGEALSDEYNEMPAVVDGYKGCIYIEPTPEIIEAAQRQKLEEKKRLQRLYMLVGMDNITADGYRVMIYSNIGTPDDVNNVLKNDSGGIGLFRSEFLYLGSKDYPSEDEQFEAYKKVLSAMDGKKVIIRTMDIGADKNIGYFNLDKEENPALGFRALRICLSRRDIFRTQLRALLRASVYGKLSIMVPMITSVEEVRQTRAILNEVKTELRAAGIPFDGAVEFGIMIETPAAVMISDLLAREVDFFSIGTNDLTQYTLAIDRQNSKLEPYYDAHHTAVLRMIRMTVQNAHKARIWCGICGELAADLSMTETFMAMGVDELSVAPSATLPLREKVRSINVDAIRDNVLSSL